MSIISNTMNRVTSMLPRAQQEPKQSIYLTARLWSKYTANSTGMNLTGLKVLDFPARAIFAITALAPTIFLTLATAFADLVLIAARGVKRAYTALTSSKEQSKLNKAIEIITNKKTLIALSSLAVVAGAIYTGYVNREAISDAAKKLQNKATEMYSNSSNYVGESYSKVSNYAGESYSKVSNMIKETNLYKYAFPEKTFFKRVFG